MNGENKLGNLLRDVSNWGWDEFAKAERSKSYSSNESIVFALVRACAMQNINAIRLSLNRLDGKLKTPVRVEYPKIYYLFPYAKALDGAISEASPNLIESGEIVEGEVKVMTDDEITEQNFNSRDEAVNDTELKDMSLRATLSKMSDYSRELPEAIVALALQTEQWLKGNETEPTEIPKVKSVMAAHLLVMAQSRNIDALTEMFDQIDGKLAETIQLLGDDLYITSYASEAPEGAYLNDHGVLQLEATQVQNLWASKLAKEVVKDG